MFKKLRIQFISIVMASVAIVLAIVFTGICVSDYQRSSNEVNEALSSAINRAAERSPRFDIGFGMGDLTRMLEGDAFEELGDIEDIQDLEEYADRFDDLFTGPRIGGRGDEQRSTVPVAVYTLTSSNAFTIAPGYTTAFIDSDVLEASAERICAAGEGSGTLTDLGLHYLKRTIGNTTYVAFADTANTDGWKPLALSLGIAALATLVVFFAISLALSNWALKPVREAWDSQRQFVADASHDLKTPLTVILANSSILLKHPDHTIAAESQWIESTQVEAQHMQGLVNEMLELAQVEAGEKASVVREQIDFSDLVDGETLLFDSMALERSCRYECEIEAGLNVTGNPQQLHKMVSTLVENAFKYVDENGAIVVTLSRSGKNAQLSVRNSGSVISPEDLPHIFDRFYRTDKARTSGAGGFGLGLAIAREVARSHGGDITCTSSADQGTTFTATLPMA